MKVLKVFNLRGNVPGEVGIEVEVEGENLPVGPAPYWFDDSDGSLRGESREYVLLKPLNRDILVKALEVLDASLNRKGTVVYDSPRTSVHVHINVRDMDIVKMFNFVFLYYLVEDMFVKWCGPLRESNSFCLRLSDADGHLDILKSALEANNFDMLRDDILRYSSLNLCALGKYGSLEFRSLKGAVDGATILEWVDMILNLKEVANNYSDPVEMFLSFSREGLENFISKIVPRSVMYSGWEHEVRKAVYRTQPLVFLTEWSILSFIDEPEEDV